MQNMLRNALWTWGTYWEPIRNLERTSWEHIGKQGKMEKKSFPPPKLKRNKSKAPWAFPLAERKINPPPPQIKLPWKVHCLLSVRIQGKLHSTVRPASGEASFSLYYKKHAQDLQGLSRAQSARVGHCHSQLAPLPCPARPCWPPSQPVSPSLVFAGPGSVVRPWRTQAPSRMHGRSGVPVAEGHCEAPCVKAVGVPGRARSPFCDGPGPAPPTVGDWPSGSARPVSAIAPETHGPCSSPPVANNLVYGPGPGSSWGDRASSPTRFNTYSRGSTHLGVARPGPCFFLWFRSLKLGRWDLRPGLVGTR